LRLDEKANGDDAGGKNRFKKVPDGISRLSWTEREVNGRKGGRGKTGWEERKEEVVGNYNTSRERQSGIGIRRRGCQTSRFWLRARGRSESEGGGAERRGRGAMEVCVAIIWDVGGRP